MDKPSVALIVGNFNGATIFYKKKPIIDLCLKSLEKTAYENYKIIVVDGNSSDNSIEYIKRKFPNVSLLKDKMNVGLARSFDGAMEFALKKYKPSYIALLNNDIIFNDKNWLWKLVNVAESDKKIGLVGCKLVYPEGKIQHAGVIVGFMPRCRGRAEQDHGQYEQIEDLEAVTGAVLLIKKSVTDKIGFWDGNYFMGFEDIDYCLRARDAGFRIVYDGSVKLTHLEGSTSTNSKDKSVRDTSFARNQRNYTYFALRHFDAASQIGAVFMALANCLVTTESKDRARSISSVRLKTRPVWRLQMTTGAMLEGYKLYKANKKYGRQINNFQVVRE